MAQTSSKPDHQKRRHSDPKAPVFIPPFRKNLKSEMPKTSVPTAVAHVPSVFVPPFKKTDVSGSDCVKDSPQIPDNSPAITSSSCENGKNHTTRKPEDQEATVETKRAEQLENHTTDPCETKGMVESPTL